MRRLWPRLNSSTFVSKKSLCIYCSVIAKNSNGKWLLPSLSSTASRVNPATTVLPLELLRYYKTSSSSLSFLASNGSTEHHKSTHNMDDTKLDSTTRLRFKAKLLADFQRSLASQDIDLIWPIYNDLYDHGSLNCVSRRIFHYLITYIIHSRASNKNLSRFKTIVEDMLTQGHQLTVSEYNALIHWVGGHTVPHRRPQHFFDAMKIFEEMQQSYCVIADKSQSSLGGGAEKKIAKEPIAPNVETFNTLINIAAQLSDLKAAQKLYHDMVFRGLKPDALTYSTLFMALGRIGDVDGIDYLLQRIHEQHEENLIKTTYIWNIIMSGYAFNGLSERAYDLFNKMKQVNQLQVQEKQRRRQFRKKGIRKRDKKQQDQLLEKKGIPRADFETFRIYIDLLLRANRQEEAVSTLFAMQQDFNVKPTVKIYNLLFKSFMHKEDSTSSTDTLYNTNIHDKSNMDSKKVHHIYQHMVDNKVAPNSETLYTLVSALLDLGDTQSALTLFLNITKSHEEGHDINNDSSCSVHSTCVKELARQRMAKLRQHNVRPSTIRIHPLLFARIRRLTSSA